MPTLFRWLLRLAVLSILLIVLAATALWYFASRSLPEYNASHPVAGITAPVEIVRTAEAVPHIFGATDGDVFFALGFAHAQDRLWQMVMLRRTVQGRLSEVIGPATLKTDEMMRRLDLYRLAGEAVPAQDEATRSALEAYAAGVNAWIARVNAGARGRGAPELFLFSNEIAYWQPQDSLAILKLMAFQLSDQAATDVLRARLNRLSPDWPRDLMPDAPNMPGEMQDRQMQGQGPAALPAYASLFDTALPAPGRADAPLAGMLPGVAASNAFAAAPRRSAAGGSLLANDPHLGLGAPSIWYLARLELASGGVIGATIPGMPLILSGRNDRLGWGVTAAYADDQDVLIEEVDPADPGRYRTPDGWKPFVSRPSIVTIKDAAPVTLTLRWTDNGPVLPAGVMGLGDVVPPGHVASLAWTALSPKDTSMSAAMALMRAGSVDQAVAAGAGVLAPVLNLTLADKDGVGLVTVGALPRRDPGHQTQGRMPAPGWVAQNRWQGVMPTADNPRILTPASGVVGNTNNKIVDHPFPDHVGFAWGDTQRIQRLDRLMQMREVHTRDSFIAAQLDTVSPAARGLLPLVGADLWFTGEPAPEGTAERQRQRALELLANWDGEMNEHLPEPLIYAAWMRALQHRLIRDELGPLAEDFTQLQPLFIERVFRNVDGAGHWCDIIQSAPIETCNDIARQALDAALLDLGARFGTNLTSWRWGDVHEAQQDHPVLGRVPMLGWLVNIRQSISGGDFTLARGQTAGTGDNPFRAVTAAGYRGVYDFADPDSSVFIISTGQSGHPFSRHYDDLAELWRRGDYIPMSLDPDLARAGAEGITRLVPEGAAPAAP
ncbi:penicillin acylase family protein [Paracoccus sp. p3-h83]|uniref:penicillin acylase family protein n=1 Tax=Paracoccus sp. p3-h83 TaxID=3342805 RepID=UPI0035B6BB0F